MPDASGGSAGWCPGSDIRHDDLRKYRSERQIHNTRGENRVVSEQKAAPAAAPGQGSNLLTRVVAALVLAPVVIVCAYVGGWLWIALVTLATIGLFVEWLMVAGAGRELRVAALGIAALLVAGISLAIGRIDMAVSILGLGLVAVVLIAPVRRGWCGAGLLYAAAAEVGSVLVRLDRDEGLVALILVLLVVWVTDIGGYFAGRGIGGPKLWPRVSPNKTWAGAVGGFVASLLVAAGFAAFGFAKVWPMLLLGAALSMASQLGDLFESAVKRHFGVKDSSHIIPGHGGLMDRLDGFVAAIVLAAIFGLLRGGLDGVGRALMVW
jgi:phosphatidate cytidylyltransferase